MNNAAKKDHYKCLEAHKVGLYTVQLIESFSTYLDSMVYVVYVPKAGYQRGYGYNAKVYNQYKTLLEAETNFAKVIKELTEHEERKAAKRAERNAQKKAETAAAVETIQVGDVFHRSLGYSMTLNEFYQVVSKKGKTLMVVKLAKEVLTGGGYSGRERPLVLSLSALSALSADQVFPVRVVGKNTISIEGDHAYLVKDSKESYYYNTMD